MTAAVTLQGDPGALADLRGRANTDPKAALREAARQFEALFMQELVKSMRATTMRSGLMDSSGEGELATGMLDQQFAGQLSGLQGGLAEAIQRQLERQMGMAPGPIPDLDGASPQPAPIGGGAPAGIPSVGAAGFIERHQSAAGAVAARSGIPAPFMIAQAAHETGWGRHEIRHADGSPSYNLFGIKAGAGWRGPVAEVTTTEYIDGQPHKVVARFRAYANYAASFEDYARLIGTSARYAGAAQADTAREFARGLQRGGYATDPAYADKLTRVINTTLRLQRAAG